MQTAPHRDACFRPCEEHTLRPADVLIHGQRACKEARCARKGHPGARRLQQGEREQQAQGCTALAAVGNGVRRNAARHPPADRCPGAGLPDCGAHGAQTAQGCPDIRVVRQIAQARLPRRERRRDQVPVRDALGGRHPHGSLRDAGRDGHTHGGSSPCTGCPSDSSRAIASQYPAKPCPLMQATQAART